MEHFVSCVQCRLCYEECRLQANAIRCVDGGVRIDLEHCNRCGHCAAVCPTGAMNHPLSPLEAEIGAYVSPEQALHFLRSPRTVRRYKEELVPKKLLIQLLNAGRYPQTAKNSQGIRYFVVRGRQKIDQIHQLYTEIVSSLPETFPGYNILLHPLQAEAKRGGDALFYDCPQLIFAVSDKKNEAASRNAQFSLTFIALMAPSLGLGTCWSGQLERLACQDQFLPKFAELIDLPQGDRISGCMMVGYPAVPFRRLVARNSLQVTWRGDD